eukprot:TRINITY_DN6024_c0_g1_i2.p1 TRINITY_DN6024_c0_g1~~TRINITY_DN6024_c0_g1_i2.p1  ORF type:complete len:134 (-),score=15.18 TRINITY_DN6024_c0_g1_i2:180-521(-)
MCIRDSYQEEGPTSKILRIALTVLSYTQSSTPVASTTIFTLMIGISQGLTRSNSPMMQQFVSGVRVQCDTTKSASRSISSFLYVIKAYTAELKDISLVAEGWSVRVFFSRNIV